MAVLPSLKKKPAPAPISRRTGVQRVSTPKMRWLNFRAPTDADVRYIERNFKFHHLDIEDLRSTLQRPKIDEYEDYLFIIFHVPYYDRYTKRLIQEEVDVFIGRDYLITFHSGKLKVLNDLFFNAQRSVKVREELLGKGPGFLLYEILDGLFGYAFQMLDRIADRINSAEQEILAGRTKEMAEELSYLKLEIINFRRIIRPQRAVVEELERKKSRILPGQLEIYFDDVLDAIGRLTDLLENFKEVAESLENTNETFIQHRTNNVVKVLTMISLVTLPGATLSGLLAMNLRYPFPVTETTFFITVLASFLVAVSLFGYMYFKRWI